MNKKKITVVKARLEHASAIKELLDYYADKQIVLPRSIVDIYEKIRIFWVAMDCDKLVGCVGLQFYWNDSAEVKSLAVDETYQGYNIGRMLVNECLEDARRYGAKRVFALTYVTDFFKKFGFESIKKESLPQKIWTECINCRHFPNCDEDAVELIL